MSLAKKGAELVAQGFNGVKFRMGAEEENAAEVDRMRALRAAVGSETKLMVDIGLGWDAQRSSRVGREMVDCGLDWLEDPIDHQDVADMGQMSSAIDTPIATGEYLYGITPFMHIQERGCADIVMVDLLRVEGITGWMKAAHLAEAFSKPIVRQRTPGIVGLCIAAAPNGLVAEHMPWASGLFESMPAVSKDDSFIVLPEKPGPSLESNQKAIDQMQP